MTASVYRTDRTGREHGTGELLDAAAEVPVYHAYGRTDRPYSPSGKWSDYTVCGRLLYLHTIRLYVMHLDRFARPCRRCWDAA